MHVELETHTGRNLATGQIEEFQQWLVWFVDDAGNRSKVGILGWKPGCKVIFTKRLPPKVQEDIKRHIQHLLEQREMPKSVQPSDVPEELLKPPTTRGTDELDEESIT